jgi:hypothetical protein
MKVLASLQSAALLGLVAGALGCRTVCPVVPVTVIGDQACGVQGFFDIRVTDPLGGPIEGVQVWEVESEPELPAPTRARLRWFTDASGRLDARPCLMGSWDFEQWQTAPEPLKVVLLVVREQYGPRRLVLNIPPSEILAHGRGVSFSVSETGAAVMQDPGYRWNTTVTLVPVER